MLPQSGTTDGTWDRLVPRAAKFTMADVFGISSDVAHKSLSADLAPPPFLPEHHQYY